MKILLTALIASLSLLTPVADKPRRRWYQYSLRSLFILTTLVAIACSWYAYEMNEAAKRRAAIAEIEKLGGGVYYYDGPHGEPPKWYSWMRKLHGDQHLGNAVYVGLNNPGITDADLVHLRGLTKIEMLYLTQSQITETGLVHLGDLANLRMLDLVWTQTTDAGLVHLKSLANLEQLFLRGTLTTDAGLVHLEGLTRLRFLDLQVTHVTDEGVKKLQKALPNCTINSRAYPFGDGLLLQDNDKILLDAIQGEEGEDNKKESKE